MVFYMHEAFSVKKQNGILLFRKIRCISFSCWHIEKDIEKLVDRFIAAEPTDGDMIFYMWGHGYELDFRALKGLRSQYERIFDKIAVHNEIVKCTNAEAFLSQCYGPKSDEMQQR